MRTVDATDLRLLEAIEDGLPAVSRPYSDVGKRIGLSEDAVIGRLKALIDSGVVSRFGVIVRHRELGYRANAMVVWDVPDDRVSDVGRRLAAVPFVTLSYRRPRRPPVWPYNLFCMIHGKDREAVERQIADLIANHGLGGIDYAVLFSRRRFKQRGARYGAPTRREVA